MSMPGFGTPTAANNSATPTDPDDAFASAGLPSADEPGGDSLGPVIGVFDAICKGMKPINSAGGWRGFALEFELTDPDVGGEEYAMLAPAYDPDARGKDRKMATQKWANIADACAAMGLAVDPQTKRPLEGFGACAGLTCRLAVSTYRSNKTGLDEPTIVLGRPKSRLVNGVEVGFPESEKSADGTFRSYGCGVLPPE